ncbi:MAG: hypothetical protein LBT94_02850 [Prevotellaceae bacterium]|jgi:hypothetical protein|nr:hypothetical protein [Prevotellaceae bacterium]
MNIYEKAGDFLVNTSQLIIGGVILANIMEQNINAITIYAIGVATVIVFLVGAYWLYRISKKK